MRIMLSCGEPSGDLYAGALVTELRARQPDVEVFGMGGPRMAAAGADVVTDFTPLSVTGLTEAIRVVPRSLAAIRHLVDVARTRRPDVFVAIDFPDFNFRLMERLSALGVPVVYYISPQLWAWRPGRIETMKRFVTRVLVIFPFEEAVYARAGIAAEFVGHPLVDMVAPSTSREDFLRDTGLAADRPVLALLPGSRRNELARIAATMAGAARRVMARLPGVQPVVAGVAHLPDSFYAPFSPMPIVRGRTDDVLAYADVAIVASGTATVQAALHERPMVVVYRLSPMTYRLGKPFVKVDTYAMANLVAGERVVPELIQDDFTEERTAEEVGRLLTDRSLHAQTRHGLARVRERLGAGGASGRAADAILAVARGPRPGR